MSGIIFEREYFIHIYETNLRKELTLPAMMSYFEEMALLQSDAAGVGFDYYHKHDVAWMLHQFEIKVSEIPRFGQKLIIRTQPVSTYKFMGFRKYWILDDQGKVMVEALTSWLFINLKSRRPQRVTDDLKLAYGHMDAQEQKIDMHEVPCLERIDFQKELFVRNSDIDVNQHVNNTHYVEWALEALPENIVEQATLTSIRISFKKETSYPADIVSQVQVDDTDGGYKCMHKISTSDGIMRCLLFSEWKSL